ncbi:2-haloacid dehalogenase [Pilibacter termitis]|uniref:2-haloacid dehalogenase n=1 Tax=Pilibacter termitis TaxID=263852 RepID=A0A1T4Q3W0_9ENTE|nr:YjjG family noncanonical pyrimidine nucleotidase [Pilibacter termitis]SJZ98505.1 2-haloacid dehalogenase [Pilibacter termitis]
MQILLFDVDNTLLDFDLAEKNALCAIYEKYGIDVNDEALFVFSEVNKHLWLQNERGEIERSELFAKRFPQVFEKLGISYDFDKNHDIDTEYRTFLSQNHALVDGALEMLNHLQQQSAQMYIVTNGTPSVSRPRIEGAGLSNFFQDIFISEEIGANKPDKRFFDFVFSKIPPVEKKEVFIIGDSLSSDILGGKNAGITTIWYNPKRQKNEQSFSADYEIQHLMELVEILNKKS